MLLCMDLKSKMALNGVKEEDLATNIDLVAAENNSDETEEKPTRKDFASVYSKPSCCIF